MWLLGTILGCSDCQSRSRPTARMPCSPPPGQQASRCLCCIWSVSKLARNTWFAHILQGSPRIHVYLMVVSVRACPGMQGLIGVLPYMRLLRACASMT